jgi:hypothetical protein
MVIDGATGKPGIRIRERTESLAPKSNHGSPRTARFTHHVRSSKPWPHKKTRPAASRRNHADDFNRTFSRITAVDRTYWRSIETGAIPGRAELDGRGAASDEGRSSSTAESKNTMQVIDAKT